MSTKLKNATFSLPPELIEKFREYAKNDYIPSINAGVKSAMELYLKKIEKEKLREEMMKAARDPLFMKDLKEIMNDFEKSDNEVSERISEW